MRGVQRKLAAIACAVIPIVPAPWRIGGIAAAALQTGAAIAARVAFERAPAIESGRLTSRNIRIAQCVIPHPVGGKDVDEAVRHVPVVSRSEEHTSELQSPCN